MALYENGKRISGIRDFPAYTWAEYHALPVAKRPKVWKCTDRDYTDVLTADDISFDPTVKNILPNTATDCQKAIDAVSEIAGGSHSVINTANPIGSGLTAPSDGYVVFANNGGSGTFSINFNNTTVWTEYNVTASERYKRLSIFVKKGIVITPDFSSYTGSYYCSFYALS